MSTNLNASALPAPATKVGGVRTPAPYRAYKVDDSLTPQTNVETALGSRSNQQDLEDALGIPPERPTPTVHDAAEHPKANASTYTPPEPRTQQHANQSRGNTHGHIKNIQQIGGAYGANRH